MDSTNNNITTNNDNFKLTNENVSKLENQLENIETQYNKLLLTIIKQTQTNFYKKYGYKNHTLEDLPDYINSEQQKGTRILKRKLQYIFMQSGGDFDSTNEKDFTNTADELLNNYKHDFLPEDNYSVKRNKEAQRLKQVVLKPFTSTYTDMSFEDNYSYDN